MKWYAKFARVIWALHVELQMTKCMNRNLLLSSIGFCRGKRNIRFYALSTYIGAIKDSLHVILPKNVMSITIEKRLHGDNVS